MGPTALYSLFTDAKRKALGDSLRPSPRELGGDAIVASPTVLRSKPEKK
jgi:hypothetical protein